MTGSRLLVQSGVHQEVVERLAGLARRIRVGDPLAEGTQVGLVQNARQLARSRTCAGRPEPGRPRRSPGAREDRTRYCYPPTILTGVRNDDIARNEAFGPVVAVIPFNDEEEAVQLANDSGFGLAGAVWTGAVNRAHRVARQVRAGTVRVNSYKTINVMAPFGGFGDSGFGRSSSLDGLLEYTQPKAVWVETDAEAPLAFGW